MTAIKILCRKLLIQILKYGIMKRFKRGIRLYCLPTFRCNLMCYYCTLRSAGGYPTSTELGLEQWKNIINNFPAEIREVVITGGEPMLYEHFVAFVTWLLKKGFYVTVYTNMSYMLGLSIPWSPRLRFDASKHSTVREEYNPFLANTYKRQGYRVDINNADNESGTKNIMQCYKCQGKHREQYHNYKTGGVCNCYRLTICPDGKLEMNMMDVAQHYTTK